jgi:hypothetical protein
MVWERYRDDFPTTSRWFTEDIAMIFFRENTHSFVNLYFQAESKLKGHPFSYSHLYTSSYKPTES